MQRTFISGGVCSSIISSGFWRVDRHKTPAISSMSLANKWKALEKCLCAWTRLEEASTPRAFGVSSRSS